MWLWRGCEVLLLVVVWVLLSMMRVLLLIVMMVRRGSAACLQYHQGSGLCEPATCGRVSEVNCTQ